MGFIDAVIQPGYLVKSLVKLALFLLLPYFYSKYDEDFSLKKLFTADKNSVKLAILLGLAVFFTIILGYSILKNFIDFSAIASNLESGVGVTAENFLYVSLYISFINSLLEEFFFRGFAFLTLKKLTNRKFAYNFSALSFALYHIAMMIGWFEVYILALAIFGLYVSGMVFNFIDEKCENIYPSWLIHICANLGINAVGFILLN